MTTVLRNAEAAALIGCTPHTLNYWRGKGRGPKFIKFGDSKNAGVGYDIADIEAWKAERRFQSTHGYAVRVAEAAKPQPAPPAPVIAPWLKSVAPDGPSEGVAAASHCENVTFGLHTCTT